MPNLRSQLSQSLYVVRKNDNRADVVDLNLEGNPN